MLLKLVISSTTISIIFKLVGKLLSPFIVSSEPRDNTGKSGSQVTATSSTTSVSETPEIPTATQSAVDPQTQARDRQILFEEEPVMERPNKIAGIAPASVNNELYQPLDPVKKEIRLVRLLRGDAEDPIRCSLYTVSLLEAPNYEALSYVWGDLGEIEHITVNGHMHAVTVNLYGALRRLRELGRSSDVWIDAICINQSNFAERGHQVHQMGQIYKRAERVIAWLGEESDNSERAFQTFEELCISPDFHWTSTAAGDISLLPESIAAVVSLLKRPWWKRVWTLQESLLPKILEFLCGARLVKSDALFSVSGTFFKHLNTCCTSFYTTCPKELVEAMLDLCVLDQYRHNYSDTDLLRLLLEYRTRECSDPRDKVYGILGLVEGDEAFNHIVPNYNISLWSVYDEITKAFICNSSRLDVLSLVLPNNIASEIARDPARPHIKKSWVPHWADGSSEDFHDIASRFERLTLYSACGDSVCSSRYRGHGALRIRGHVIGTIAAVGNVTKSKDIRESIAVFESWRAMYGIDKGPSQQYHVFDRVQHTHTENAIFPERFIKDDDRPVQSMSDAFWLTLCSSVSGLDQRCVLIQDLDSQRQLYQLWWDWATQSGANIDSLEAALAESSSSPMDIFRATANILVSTAMRRFAVTDTTLGCIGLVPRNTEIGDKIVLFAGARVPMIIRDNTFGKGVACLDAFFIGDAYIHGIMHGEVWDDRVVKDITLF